MDLSRFSDENFEVKDWVNGALNTHKDKQTAVDVCEQSILLLLAEMQTHCQHACSFYDIPYTHVHVHAGTRIHPCNEAAAIHTRTQQGCRGNKYANAE